MPTLRMLLLALVAGALMIVPSTASAVVGGQDASRPYPHMAELRADGDYICGASLVAPDKILTAAHCVEDSRKDPTKLSFVLGRTTRSDTASGEEIRARGLEIHPNYDPDVGNHDVAIVTLERSATKGSPIRIASPSEKALWAPGEIATVIGWGTRVGFDVLGVTVTDRLQEVDVPMVADADCDQSYQLTFGGIDETTEVCAGELHGTKDSCNGDSGGPLMVPDASGALVQAGVVSWGFGCGYPTQYGVYARVGDDTLYNWITPRLTGAAPTPTTKPKGKKPR